MAVTPVTKIKVSKPSYVGMIEAMVHEFGTPKERICKHLKVTRQTINYWLSGENRPSEDNGVKIHELYNAELMRFQRESAALARLQPIDMEEIEQVVNSAVRAASAMRSRKQLIDLFATALRELVKAPAQEIPSAFIDWGEVRSQHLTKGALRGQKPSDYINDEFAELDVEDRDLLEKFLLGETLSQEELDTIAPIVLHGAA